MKKLKEWWFQMFGWKAERVRLVRPVEGMTEKELIRCFANAEHYPSWKGVMLEMAAEQEDLLNLASDPRQPAEIVKCYMVAFGRVTAVRNALESRVQAAQALAREEAKRGEGD